VMTVLYAFDPDEEGVPLSVLVRRTGLPKGTLHRVLGELVHVRLVERVTNGYRLGGALYELGLRASAERRLREIAMPFLQDLYERTHETVHLAVREGVEVVYIEKIGGHRQARTPSRVGGRMPLHSTALGKALLANAPDAVFEQRVGAGLARLTPHTVTAPGLLRRQLATIAQTGIAFEHEESAIGVSCVAAAVLGPGEEPIAAVSVSGLTGRFRPQDHANFVRAVAGGIAATLARRASLLADG
ncbi:MAG: IclR family transcriptional regulator, partial [Jatrophihabitans sp.]